MANQPSSKLSVVLRGREEDEKTTALNELLINEFPKEIPHNYVYLVNIMHDEHVLYSIEGKHIKKDINLKDPHLMFDTPYFRDKEVNLVEIVIDLQMLKEDIEADTEAFLANCTL